MIIFYRGKLRDCLMNLLSPLLPLIMALLQNLIILVLKQEYDSMEAAYNKIKLHLITEQ